MNEPEAFKKMNPQAARAYLIDQATEIQCLAKRCLEQGQSTAIVSFLLGQILGTAVRTGRFVHNQTDALAEAKP